MLKTVLPVLAGALLAGSAPALEVRATATSGEAERLVDGIFDDRGAFQGIGVPLVIEVAFSEPRDFLKLRIHPGFRAYTRMPSTEGSPKELTVSAWVDEAWVPVTGLVEIPRDPGTGAAFFVDIPLDSPRTDRLKIDLFSSHDPGRRVGSGDEVVVPPEGRSVYIRQLEFFSAELRKEQESGVRALRERFDARVAEGDALGLALQAVFDGRVAQLEEALEAAPEDLRQHRDWLEKELSPYLETRCETGGDTPELTLRCEGATIHTPVEFPVHFKLLELAGGRPLSRDRVEVQALDEDGETRPVHANLDLITPDRGVLGWRLTGAGAYRIRFAPAGETDDSPQRLLGAGDHMMTARFADAVFPPGDFWSARTADLFDTGTPDLVAGFFTDYAHIYRNRARDGSFAFDDRRHFVARDPFDQPIATTDYHGRATAIADPADLDGSGRIDLVLSRFNAEIPLFARNIGDRPGALEYDSARPLKTLKSGYRYAYGDLDGDGLDDAVGVRASGGMVEVSFWRNTGEEQDGAPRFAAPVRLAVDVPDSVQHARSTAGRSPVASLDDLNGNGLLDLSVLAPPYLYVAFARPGEQLAFDAPQRVLYHDGVAFNSGFYFPHFGWQDLNGDGVPDLMLAPGLLVHVADGSVLTLRRERERVAWLRQQRRLIDPRLGMAGFDIVARDGRPAFLQVDDDMQLRIHPYEDGLFGDRVEITLEAPGTERYGCPDDNEYASLYAQIKAVDLDGDGLPDLLLNTEHNWRFGYFSFYRNLGDGRFAPEEALAPLPDRSHLRTVSSPGGKALVVDREANLDYLSLETDGLLSPEGGRIVFSYAPLERDIGNAPRTFFSSGFWRRTPEFSPHQLYQLYLYSKTVEELFARVPYFALLQMPDGTLRFQVGSDFVATPRPVALEPGEYTTLEVHWDPTGAWIFQDGRRLAGGRATPERFAERIHLGSLGWHGVQRDREYHTRFDAHPVDFSFPANGRFDYFRIEDLDGNVALDLDFDEKTGGLERRSRISYRSTPGFTVYRGQPAMVAHFGDHRRIEKGDDQAVLHVIPFETEPGRPPRFGEAVPLALADGSPFHSFSRTQVVPIDWNGNGQTDILLSSPGFANLYHRGVELFLNDGAWRFTRSPDPEINRLNERLHAHHDTKLVPAALCGGTEPDLATWTDPGLRVYSRPFLQRGTLRFQVDTMHAP